jgi:hypothetical protein
MPEMARQGDEFLHWMSLVQAEQSKLMRDLEVLKAALKQLSA